MRMWYGPIIFVFFLGVGLWLTDRSWHGMLYVYIGEPRSPAAVRDLGQYSSIDSKALSRSVEAQLLADAQVFKDQGLVGIQLGNPLLNRPGGGKEFGCQVQDLSGAYDHIELEFVGTGISESGETPRMIAQAKCRSDQDLNTLETIWIPMRTLMAATPKAQEFDFASDNLVKITFESIPHMWPENWVLWSVRFYRENDANSGLSLDATTMKSVTAQLLSFDWKVQ